MATTPLVSVILPTYCRAQSGHLRKAIESVLAQGFDEFELIIVDDSSVDGSSKIIGEYKKRDARVRTLRLPRHLGFPAKVTALGYASARADVITWMFDDCELTRDSLAVRVRELSSRKDLGMIYGKIGFHQNEGRRLLGELIDEARLAEMHNMVPNVAVMLRRDVLTRVGWYDPHVLLKRLCDWDLWWRIVRGGIPWSFIDEVLAEEHGSGLANSLGRTAPLYGDLTLRYASIDRSARLDPAQVVDADSFSEDWSPDISKHDRFRQRLLAVDHCCRNGQFELLKGLIGRWTSVEEQHKKVLDPGIPSPRSSIEWVAQLYLWERDSLGASIAAMEADYRKVLAAADERQALIDAERKSHSEAQRALEVAQEQSRLACEKLANDVVRAQHDAQVSAQEAARLAEQHRAESETIHEELRRARDLVVTLQQEIDKARSEHQRLGLELELARRQAALAWRDANDFQKAAGRSTE